MSYGGTSVIQSGLQRTPTVPRIGVPQVQGVGVPQVQGVSRVTQPAAYNPPCVQEVKTGMTQDDWIKYGSYAGYGGVGIGVIIFILLVIAVIVLWIRMNKLASESREYLVIRYNGDSKDYTLTNDERNILFINETKHQVKLYVCPKSSDNGNSCDNGGDVLVVKNTKCKGCVKIVPTNGLVYSSGSISDGNIVSSNIASEFCWVNDNELMRLT